MIEHLGSGPWCQNGTCRVCQLYKKNERYRQALEARKGGIAKPVLHRPVFERTVPEPEEAEIVGSSAQEQVEPSMLARMGNFARAATRHVANGMKYVGEEEYARRLAVCRGEREYPKCDEYLSDYPGGRCRKCGCKLAGKVLSKARWKHEKCPLGKWEEAAVAAKANAEQPTLSIPTAEGNPT